MLEPITFLTPEQELYMMSIQEHLARPTLISVHIADIHFGAIHPKLQYEILKEQVINPCYNINFDVFSIDGDLFDHKYMSYSDAVLYATMFIKDVVDLCRQKNATIVIIHGTFLHDSNQLKLFYHYLQDPTIDIRIVEQVKFEYIKGAKILCIPELYGKDKEYYDKFLFYSGEYDEVYMHGTLSGSIYGTGGILESEKHSDKAPIFTIDDFDMCHGPIMSGHVHNPGCFNKYFYYCGSPYTWKHGEADNKGFFITMHNLETHEFYCHFQQIQAFRFATVNLDDMVDNDPKEVIDYINRLKADGIYNLRVIFDLDDLSDKQASNLQLIKTYFRNTNDISIKTKDRKKQQIEQVNKEILDKYKGYEFINDKSLTPYDILSRYINKKKGCVYTTADEIKELVEMEV